MEQRQYAHGDHHVVRQSDNHTGRQSPLKAETDVHQDGDQRHQQRHRTGLRQVSTHAWADELNTLNRRVLAGCFVNHANNLTAQLLAAVGIVHRRHTHHDVAAAAEVLQQRLFKARFLQRFAHLVHINRFFQGDFNYRTTGKIETPVKAFHAHNDDGQNQQET